MVRVFELAKEYQVPVLIHFQYEMYNHGFERFYKVLERFPDVNFLGHAQTWWAILMPSTISRLCIQKAKSLLVA